MRFFVVALGLALLASEAEGGKGSLKGGPDSQKRQNRAADRHNLSRLGDREELARFVKKGLLVSIADADAYYLGENVGSMDPDHAGLYRHARPWVKRFLDRELGEGFRLHGERFKVASLVRTRAYQKKLRRKNRNAISGKEWWKRSSHLTGSTVDISYKDLSKGTRRWLEKRLRELERKGLVEATKERRSACYHVMVFPDYGKPAKKRKKARR